MARTPPVIRRFPFAFDARYRMAGRFFGIDPDAAWVQIGDGSFNAKLGPWRVRTPMTNLASVETSGPYSVPKTIGPAHLSFSDRGLTFASNAEEGVCVTFHRPVTGLDPFRFFQHPGLTVTVAEPEELAEALGELIHQGTTG